MNKKLLLALAFAGVVRSASGQIYNNPGGTISACSGIFYDTGGAGGNYSNNENIVTTICSSSPDSCIRADFTSFYAESNRDFLTIYDAANTNSGIIGTYTFNASPGTITSSKGCLTFKFTSDNASPAAGWSADLSCVSACAPPVISNPGGTLYLCSGNFYDSGGPKNNYGNNENIITTLCPDIPGNLIRADFSDFYAESNKDFLRIYDGPTTASLLIGTYTFNNSPGTVISTAGCLTFRFTSDGASTSSGWTSAVSCTSPVAVAEIPPLKRDWEVILENMPATSVLNGRLYATRSETFNMYIFDMHGRTLLEQKVVVMRDANDFKLDVSGLADGLYFLKTGNSGDSILQKFLKF